MTAHGAPHGVKRRLKVLVSAYACEPGRGSEPGVGWNWVRRLAADHDLWVVTRAKNRRSIEAASAAEGLANINWVYVDFPAWVIRLRGTRAVQLYYYFWQRRAGGIARKLHAEVGFDLVHHLTFGVYWMPSFLAAIPVPFLWGPVGGAESTPRELLRTYGLRGRVSEAVRDLARWVFELTPAVRATARGASLITTKAPETAARVRKLSSAPVRVCPESGMSAEELAALGAFPVRDSGPVRFVSVGRLIHWKGFHLGLEAFARLDLAATGHEYWIIGDGPERKRLESQASRLGIEKSVTFLGARHRREVLHRLASCDVLVHPSMHDSGGWVCLEGMAAGRPVICLDVGGPAVQVSSETGFRIPPGSPEQVVGGIARAMDRLASDAALRARMAEAGRRRVSQFYTWEVACERMKEIYMEAFSRQAPVEAVGGLAPREVTIPLP